MQFTFDGKLYKIIRITGPSHNLLGVSFGDSNNGSLDVEALPNNSEESGAILKKNIQEQVLLGINEINDELGTNYSIQKIQFVSSDTPSVDIYKELVKELVKRIECKGEFKLVCQ